MTEKQKIFADEYLIDLNATRAYKAAYPSVKKDDSARANASKLLTNTNIKIYIDERMKEREKRTEVTQDKVLKELALIGFSKATDFAKVIEKQAMVEVGDTMVPMLDENGNPVMYRTVELTLSEDLTEEQQRALAVVKKGRDGLEAKPCDKIKALELIGRHLGMWNDKLTVDGEMSVKNPYENLTEDELKKLIQDG